MQVYTGPRTLTENDAAIYLGMSRSWLAQARMRGDGPPFVKLGRSVRYLRDDLDAWLTERRRSNTVGMTGQSRASANTSFHS